jgi:soluble lytic murein transglycosylase-like protein
MKGCSSSLGPVAAALAFNLAACGSTAGPQAPPRQLTTGDAVVDQYDELILGAADGHGHPDPMLTKAMMAQESSFDREAVSADAPCGIPAGWTSEESRSLGLLQVTPACTDFGLKPDGHPSMAKSAAEPYWEVSLFNPAYNVDRSVFAWVAQHHQFQSQYPGCSENDYRLMATAAYNQGQGGVSGCAAWNAGGQTYLDRVLTHYRSFAGSAGWPNPY